MADAGAVGGVTPTIPTGTATSPQDGSAKASDAKAGDAKAGDARGAEGKPSAPPLAETSGRAPPETAPKSAPEPALALAATLAGLKAGQELRGTVRLLPGQPQALLTTPQGDFLIDPATGLEPDSPVSLVLIRADRTISALLLTMGRGSLDVPRPVRLTLVSIHGAPAPELEAQATPGAPIPPAPARPAGVPVPPAPAPTLTSLLPGETISLRGGQPPLTGGATPQAPASLPASSPPASSLAASPLVPSTMPGTVHGLAPGTPRPMVHGLVLPDALDTAAPVPAASGSDPLAPLFDRGVMPLALHIGTGARTGPVKMLAASLLATAAPGETSPLTHPPAQSPLARLAEAGRLVTVTALPLEPETPAPPQAQPLSPRGLTPRPETPTPTPTTAETVTTTAAALPALARPALHQTPASQGPTGFATPPAATASPAAVSAALQSQPVQLSVNGAAARIELPAGVPTPAPGTQLVFLVTTGHEVLRTLPAAPLPAVQPRATTQPQFQPQQHVPPPQAQPTPLPQPAGTPTPAQTAEPPAAPPQTAQPPVPPQTVERGGPAAATGRSASSNQTPPAPNLRTDHAQGTAAPRSTGTVQAPAAPVSAPPAAPHSIAALPEQPGLAWVPGMALPAGVTPAAPAAVSGGGALLMAVMQALGRKGFSATPRNPSDHPLDADGAEGVPGLPALARLLQSATATASAAASTATARAEQAQDAPLAASAPDALPFALTLQTPQGQVPLVFLVWQPVHANEDGRNDSAAGEDEGDVCFAVEVEFESIGRLRLRGALGRTHLDLGVETERALGAALHQAAHRDFAQAIEAGGMTGTLVFRHREGR